MLNEEQVTSLESISLTLIAPFVDALGADRIFRKTISVEARDNESIRRLAITALNAELLEASELDHAQFDSHSPLSISIGSEQALDSLRPDGALATSWVDFDLDDSGAIVYIGYMETFQHDFTLGRLKELVGLGYVSGNPNQISVTVGQGIGATGGLDLAEFVRFLNDSGITATFVFSSLSSISVLFGRKFWSWIRDRKARKLAAKWKQQNLDDPRQLRRFFDRRIVWSHAEVCNRLKINSVNAKALMNALGYELIGPNWALGDDQVCLAARAKWLELESRYRN